MVKSLRKPKQSLSNTINSVLAKNKTPPKSRQQIYQENYQKNKEKKKQQRKERYQQQKNQRLGQYYETDSIQILMSLKDYTELSPAKQKLWLDFIWTFKDLNKTGFYDVIQIMKISEEANKLIRDYWETAKKETHQASSWNNLSEEQQAKLIKYWGREKARQEKELANQLAEQEKQGQDHEKDIEIAKYHEERGKIKCDCWQCEEQKQIQAQVKAEQKKVIKDSETEQETEAEFVKGECANCFEVKKVDSDSGLCKKCSAEEREVENV